MNLWLILVGQPGPASNRNSAGKAQPPTAVIGGRFPPDPFLKGALPEVGFGVTGGQCLTGGERQLRVGLASSTAFRGTPAIGASRPLRRIPAIVSFLNPQPALSLISGNHSSCPAADLCPSPSPDRGRQVSGHSIEQRASSIRRASQLPKLFL